MKRLPIWFILASILVSVTACGDTSSNVDTTSDVDTTTVPAVDPLKPSTVEDFDGRTFRILSSLDQDYICADGLNGNGINDAMYNRELKTEHELNVEIEYELVGTIGDMYPKIKSSVMAGDADYDLVISHVNMDLVSYVGDNLIMDWNTLPHVDFTKPYWNQHIIESLSIGGKIPYAAGDLSIMETVFLLYNKELGNNLQLGSLYDDVFDGTWTWDKLAEISSIVKNDINGDGVYSESDRYGVVVDCNGSSWMLRNIPGSCGQFIYENTSNGINLIVNNERTTTILDKTISLFNGGGGFIISGASDDSSQESSAAFARGTYLTYFVSCTSAAYAFNDLPFDYGVLPLPKYDAAQENYSALSWSCNQIVPNTADPNVSGLVSEWLNYYGYNIVRPEFYDSLLSVRFAQDEETIKVLDIIFDNITYDPGMSFKSRNFYNYFDNMVMSNSNKFSSTYAAKEKGEMKYIASLTEAFENFNS